MPNQPLVSIGLPTYNRPKELKKALFAIVNQTYKNLEIILSDNCSTIPEVQEICLEYCEKDARIKYFRQKENLGINGNGQFLIDNISGKYAFLMCDDDWISENFIKEAVGAFLSNPNCGLVYGRTKLYDTDYSIIEDTCHKTICSNSYCKRASEYIFNAMPYRLATGVVKTTNLKHIHEYTKNRFCEDQIFMAKMLYFGDYVILPQICYHKLNNGATKDLETLKANFNIPHLTHENLKETVFETIFEAILHDEFYCERFNQEERANLVLHIRANLAEKGVLPKSKLKYTSCSGEDF